MVKSELLIGVREYLTLQTSVAINWCQRISDATDECRN